MFTIGELNRLATMLRIAIAPYPGYVMVIDGDKAGDWIEISRENWFFTTNDQNGPWGVTVFTAEPNDVPNSFLHELDWSGINVHWYCNREDGPSEDEATVDSVFAYLLQCGILSGTPPKVDA